LFTAWTTADYTRVTPWWAILEYMDGPARDDPRRKTDVGTPTVRIGDSYSDDNDLEGLAGARPRRGFLLWLPLVIFVVVLIAATIIGHFAVPPAGSTQSNVAPTQTTMALPPAPPPPVPTASVSSLPTPPPRPADALVGWATKISAATGIPVVAVAAYGYGQLLMQHDRPTCHLGWTTLAGIGEVESDHGRAGGAILNDNGRSAPPINGPALDGHNGRMLVKDTDAGAYDGDATYDHQMGPMHLLPSVWATYRVDADGDGIMDPYDIDDASAALARYLCSGPEDLNALAGWQTAVGRFRSAVAPDSAAYESSVFKAADSYGQRTSSIG
jgi:hypothetical protein